MSHNYGINYPASRPPQGIMPGSNQANHAQPDLFSNTFQNVSPEMINFGLSAGQDILSKQKDRWMPGVSIFWNSLKIYFAVNNTYVVKKILTILYPLSTTKWTRRPSDDVNTRESLVEITNHKYALPPNDTNAPDLYIPLMSFLTYILLVGYVRGTSNKFTPEALIHSVWMCLFLQSIETLIIKIGLNTLQVTLPILDVFSYTGYKYVSLCLCTSLLFLGTYIHLLFTLYAALMLAYFVLKSLAGVVPEVSTTGPPRYIVLLLFALMQFVVVCFLSWT